jgi:hypothetical protein
VKEKIEKKKFKNKFKIKQIEIKRLIIKFNKKNRTPLKFI